MHQAGLRGAYRSSDGFEAAGTALWTLRHGSGSRILPAKGKSPEEESAHEDFRVDALLIHGINRWNWKLKLPRFTAGIFGGQA